jgi:uncharacterized membrane protein HdeD (DUF308 family)
MESMHIQKTLDPNRFSKNWGWFLFWGLILIFLGVVAIFSATATTLISVMLLGVILIISGIVMAINAFISWRHRWGSLFFHLFMGILYLIAGILLVNRPLLGSVSITLFLGVFYLIIGGIRIFSSLSARFGNWGWSLFNGIITLLLGILILANWPASSLFIIGLFVGIDLLILGWTFVIGSLTARRRTTRMAGI